VHLLNSIIIINCIVASHDYNTYNIVILNIVLYDVSAPCAIHVHTCTCSYVTCSPIAVMVIMMCLLLRIYSALVCRKRGIQCICKCFEFKLWTGTDQWKPSPFFSTLQLAVVAWLGNSPTGDGLWP
jgi:hypothetical protein